MIPFYAPMHIPSCTYGMNIEYRQDDRVCQKVTQMSHLTTSPIMEYRTAIIVGVSRSLILFKKDRFCGLERKFSFLPRWLGSFTNKYIDVYI